MDRTKITIASLIVFLCAAIHAGYDEAGGYVTLLVDENAKISQAKNSLDTAGNWSDGREPHSGTNYFAEGIVHYPAVFKGDSLTVSEYMRRSGGPALTWATMESNPLVIDDLRLLDGARIAQYGSKSPIVFNGKLTLFGAADLVAGKIDGSNIGWVVMRMKLVGDETTDLRIQPDSAYSSASAGTAANMTGSFILGDTSDFLGTVSVWFNQTAFLGENGFPNAKEVKLHESGYSRLASWAPAGTSIPVSRITVPSAATLVLPVSNKWTVSSMKLAAGAVIDCSGMSDCAVEDCGMVVSGGFESDGKIVLDLGNVTGIPVRRLRILSVPKTVKELKPDDFEVINNVAYSGLKLVVETVGDSSEACLVCAVDMPVRPEKYDESTGYVVLTKSDTSATSLHSWVTAGNWSDGLAPHAGTNYFHATSGLWADGGEFKGDRLVTGRYLRMNRGAEITVNDWWILPSGGADYADRPTMITTEGARKGTNTVNGTATLFTTESHPFCFLGGWENNTWKINLKFIGSGAGLVFQGPTSREPGNPDHSFTACLIGDMSEFYGVVSVNTNYTLRLGANGLPNAALKVLTEYSRVSGYEAGEMTIPVSRFFAVEPATLEPLEGNVFSFGSIVAEKSIVKEGAGTLAVAGTAEVGADAVLNVNAGAIQPRSAGAFDGLSVDFAEGTKLVVDVADEGALLQTDKAVTASDLEVELLGVDKSHAGLVIPVARLKTGFAQALFEAATLARLRGFNTSIELGEEDAEGFRTVGVKVSLRGFTVSVR